MLIANISCDNAINIVRLKNVIMNKIFVIDWSLLLLLIATVVSGFVLHVVDHKASHEVCEIVEKIHAVVSISFFVVILMHIKMHFAWYKSLLKSGFSNKSVLSAFMSIFVPFVAISGILLLFLKGMGIGFWHYRFGIVMGVVCLIHIIKRFNILRKSIKK